MWAVTLVAAALPVLKAQSVKRTCCPGRNPANGTAPNEVCVSLKSGAGAAVSDAGSSWKPAVSCEAISARATTCVPPASGLSIEAIDERGRGAGRERLEDDRRVQPVE